MPATSTPGRPSSNAITNRGRSYNRHPAHGVSVIAGKGHETFLEFDSRVIPFDVRVRGPVKVAAHLSFGLIVIAAEQMLRMLG